MSIPYQYEYFSAFTSASKNLKWSISALSIFPLLPNITELSDHRWLVILTQILAAIGLQNLSKKKLRSKSVALATLWLALLTQTLVFVSSLFALSPPKTSIFLAWVTFISSTVIPLYEREEEELRILAIFSSSFTCYSLLSTCYEPLFLLLLMISLYFWMTSEKYQHQSCVLTIDKINMEDLKLVITFLFFVFLAFFGCGNIASLNSFSPSSIIPFVHIYSPHLMALLLFMKVILPFIPVCSVFLVIIRRG